MRFGGVDGCRKSIPGRHSRCRPGVLREPDVSEACVAGVEDRN